MQPIHQRSRFAVALTAFALGCAGVPRLQPEGEPAGANDALRLGAGVQLHVLANAWQGEPSDLPQKFVPLWIGLSNSGHEAFNVTLGSFELVDDAGAVHPSLPPEVAGVASSAPSSNPAPSGRHHRGGRRSASGSAVSPLREGRLDPNTQARGFVFFDRPPNAKRLVLHVRAPAVDSNDPPLELELPFLVDSASK